MNIAFGDVIIVRGRVGAFSPVPIQYEFGFVSN
jgi:hypothetical protein